MPWGPSGGAWRPRAFDRKWRRFRRNNNSPVRFHDLRHRHASQLLAAGVRVTVVSEWVGHASMGITLDTYSHVMPALQEEAAEEIEAGLKKALAGQRQRHEDAEDHRDAVSSVPSSLVHRDRDPRQEAWDTVRAA